MVVQLVATKQHAVDVDKLPVCLHQSRVECERGQQRRFRKMHAVSPQLDLSGQQSRLRGGRVAVGDFGHIGDRLVGMAERLRHLGRKDEVARVRSAEPRQCGRGVLVPPGPKGGLGVQSNPVRVSSARCPGPPRRRPRTTTTIAAVATQRRGRERVIRLVLDRPWP